MSPRLRLVIFAIMTATAVLGHVVRGWVGVDELSPAGVRAAIDALGWHGPLLFFLLPPFLLRPLATFRPLRALLSALMIPLVSLGIWAVVILGWVLLARSVDTRRGVSEGDRVPSTRV